MAETAIDRARRLIDSGQRDEAYRALCDAASDTDLHHLARESFAKMFPIPRDAQEWIDNNLPALLGGNSAARTKAAKALTKVAVAEYGYNQRDRIGHPEAMKYIINALSSDDSKVAEAAIIATARVAQFYYRDPGASQPALKLLRSPKVVTRRWAVQATTYLEREEAAETILPLLSDKSVDVQTEVARMIMSLAQSKRLSERAKSDAIHVMLDRFASYASGVRNVILNAVREIQDPSAVEALRKASESEPDEHLRKKISDIIRTLTAESAN